MSVDDTLEREGRVWFRDALTAGELAALDEVCVMNGAPGVRLQPGQTIHQALAPLDRVVGRLMPHGRAVRLVAFDKSAEANWALPWHQDRVIAVRERHEIEGFGAWTRKTGVWHVEPPIGLLEQMIFLRVHLDAADEASGCLELARGTHALGFVAAGKAAGVAEAHASELCVAKRGDVLAAKALILHRSRASARTVSRRALRVDYSANELPTPLEWAL